VSLRIRGLGDADPAAIPLPHGTEVTTRVARVVGGRRVPEGAVGRVVGLDGDEVDVEVVGVGRARYRRDELAPRKAGQARFAVRREAAWAALRSCVVLETTVGSRAWGLADAASDTDTRGVFVLPFAWGIGLGAPPEELCSADGSETFWEAGKAIRQGLRADPNTLETLFVPSVRALDPIGEELLAARDAFVSAEIHASFGRYALSQLRKLEQSLRLAEHRGLLLDWLRAEPAPSLDEVAARMAAEGIASGPTPIDAALRARDYVKQLYRSLHDQGLIAGADFASLTVFARGPARELDLPRELRPKNAYNLIRLIDLATGWLRTGRPVFAVEGELRDRLLAIKRGEVPLAEVLRQAEGMTPALEEARRETPLPRRPDLAVADALLRRVREEAARRWAAGAPGPLGAAAPPPPPLAWEEP
jgi:hypothetical protein